MRAMGVTDMQTNMPIRILCVGNLKEDYLRKAQAECIERLSSRVSVSVTEISDKQSGSDVEVEGIDILKKISATDYTCAMVIEDSNKRKNTNRTLYFDIIGKALAANKQRITYIIGGSNGLSKAVLSASSTQFSLTRLTFPHQLVRIILLEGICYETFNRPDGFVIG